MSLLSNFRRNSYNGSSVLNQADATGSYLGLQVNVGINAELFNGRLALSVDGYYQREAKRITLPISVHLLQLRIYYPDSQYRLAGEQRVDDGEQYKIFDGHAFKWELATNLLTKKQTVSIGWSMI